MASIRPRNLEVIEKALSGTEIPEGFAVYDFGGGCTVAPTPDIKGEGFLVDHMSAIERVRNTEKDPKCITGFRYDLQFVRAEQIKDLMLKAVEYNRTQLEDFHILEG